MKKLILSFLLIGTAVLSFAQPKPDALKLYTSGNYKESVAVCEQELAVNPYNLDSYAVMCWSLIGNGQYNEAEQRATQARKINPYDVRIMEVLGEENGSRVGKAYYFMGEIFIRQARFEHADIALTTAVRTEPLYDAWWARLGYSREMTKDYKGAIAAYDKALALNSAQTDAKLGRQRCQSKIN